MARRGSILSAAALAAVSIAWPAIASAPFAAALNPQTVSAAVITPHDRGSWPVYHRDDAHDGADPAPRLMSGVRAGWVSPLLDGQVYASPLVYGGLVYGATLNNTVYALDQGSGHVFWSTNLGAPVSSGWTCGNVSPQGILGTPAIDPATRRIYVAALTSDHVYRVSALDLLTGQVMFSTPIPTNVGTNLDWKIEQERGALAVANGYVYVPFGGRAGDCGSYHGWVFAVPTSGTGAVRWYETPGIGAGFWAAGGVVVDDITGKVFVTSGNGTGSGCNANAPIPPETHGTPVFENDAVVRLSATLAHEDAFIPEDWQGNWCGNDEDLGSASPVLIPSVCGSVACHLAFQSGKWGTGFILDPNHLGGMNGQLYPTPQPAPTFYTEQDVCLGQHSSATFGSFAYSQNFIYVQCNGHGVVGLKFNGAGPSFTQCGSSCPSPDWQAGGTLTFGPPIVAHGAVWVIDINGSGLYAYRATDGALLYHSSGFSTVHFATPAEAGGQVFVPANQNLRQFVMGFPPATSIAGPIPPRPNPPAQQPGGTASGRPTIGQASPQPPPPR